MASAGAAQELPRDLRWRPPCLAHAAMLRGRGREAKASGPLGPHDLVVQRPRPGYTPTQPRGAAHLSAPKGGPHSAIC